MNIIETLKNFKSSSIDDFTILVTEIEKSLIEITSNIKYLNLFVDYCCDFEIPNDIDDYTTKILYLIRFVAINSKFYNSPYVQKKIVIYFLLLKLKIRFENYLNLSTTLTDKNINVYYIFFLKFELNNSLKRLQITRCLY